MRQIFVGRWIKGFGKVMQYFTREMGKTEEERRREKILFFWKKHGLAATKDAFHVSRSVLFLWKKKQREGALAPKSKRPRRIRVPTLSQKTRDAICRWRKALPYLGKEKISFLLKKEGICVSPSSVGRIIKRENLPSAPRQYVARRKKRIRRERKPLDYEIKNAGDLVALDTVVLQENGKKKYIITAIDLFSRISLARNYSRPTSKNAADLLRRMQIALGVPIKAVNTDNGGEFLLHFEKACKKEKIKHFFTFPRTPKMNAFAERFNRTLQEEATFPLFSEPIEVWNRFLSHYLMQYNFFRPHSSLEYKTPVEVFLEKRGKSKMLWTHTFFCLFPKIP